MNFGINIKEITPKIPKLRIKRKGERTLTKGDKKKEIEKVKKKCQKCKKTFPIHQLDIHHKRGVGNYKSKGLVDIPYIEFYLNKKKKAYYDRSKNLTVLCKLCHADVHKEERDKRKAKNKTTRKSSNVLGIEMPKILKMDLGI